MGDWGAGSVATVGEGSEGKQRASVSKQRSVGERSLALPLLLPLVVLTTALAALLFQPLLAVGSLQSLVEHEGSRYAA